MPSFTGRSKMVVLPAPIRPTRKMLAPCSMGALYRVSETKLTCCGLIRHDTWRDEYQQLGARGCFALVAKKHPYQGQLTQHRHTVLTCGLRLFENATDHHGAAILNKHLCFDVLRVNLNATRIIGPRFVLIHINTHDDVWFRSDLRLHP